MLILNKKLVGIDFVLIFMLLLLKCVGILGENDFWMFKFLIIFDGNKLSGIIEWVGFGFGIYILLSWVFEYCLFKLWI